MNRFWILPALGVCLSLMLLGWLLNIAYWPAHNGLDISDSQIGRDFINDWAAPQIAAQGNISLLSNVPDYTKAVGRLFGHEVPILNWSYPPTTLLLAYPFAQLPYFAALGLWTLLGLGIVVTLFRIWCPKNPWALVGFLLSPALIINLISGQNGFFTAGLFLGGLLALQRYPKAAGIAFGVLTFKPHLGMVLPFALLVLRAWKTIAAAVITTLILVTASLLVYGPAIWKDYFTQIFAVQMSYLYGFSGFYTSMIDSPFAGLRRMGFNYHIAMGLQLVLSCFVVSHMMVSLGRVNHVKRRALIVVTAMALISPYIFNYDMVALSIPLTCFLWSDRHAVWWERGICLIAWLSPLFSMFAGMHCPILQITAPLAYGAVFLMACHREQAISIDKPPQDGHNLA